MNKARASEGSFFDRLKGAMEESIAYSRDQLSLKTTELPAPPPAVSARQVIRLRERYNMSQGVFAAALNVSPKTVQSWEQGSRRPNQGALRLLEIFDRQPDVVREFFGVPGRSGNGSNARHAPTAIKRKRRSFSTR